MPLPLVLLDAPQGSLDLDAPSPKGLLDGEESKGGAGSPHASSVLAGAKAGGPHGSLSALDASPNGSELLIGEEALAVVPQGSDPVAGGEVAGAPHAAVLL